MSAHLAGEIESWPPMDRMEALLRDAGLEVLRGRFSLRIVAFPHFVFGEYGGDLGSPTIEADAENAAELLSQARRVSQALARAGVRHRFEIYDADDVLAGYLHHAWPAPGCGESPDSHAQRPT